MNLLSRDFEVRLCSIILIVSLLFCCISLIMLFEPALILLFTRTIHGFCYIDSYIEQTGIDNCTKPSCAKTCTSSVYKCAKIQVSFLSEFRFDYPSLRTELFADVDGCGYYLNCDEFYSSYNREGKSFECFYLPNFNVAMPYDTQKLSRPFYRLFLSFLPLIIFFICFFYTFHRRLLSKGKPVPIKVPQPPPKSFYEMRTREIEDHKRARELRKKMQLYGDNVNVEELKAVTSLLYKPSFYWKNKLNQEAKQNNDKTVNTICDNI